MRVTAYAWMALLFLGPVWTPPLQAAEASKARAAEAYDDDDADQPGRGRATSAKEEGSPRRSRREEADEDRPSRRRGREEADEEERPRRRGRRDRDDQEDEGRGGRRSRASANSPKARLALARQIRNSFQNKLPADDPLQAKAYAVEKAEEERYRKFAAEARGARGSELREIEEDYAVSEPVKNVLDDEPSYDEAKKKMKAANQAAQDAEDDFLDAKEKFKPGQPEREKAFKAHEDAKKELEAAKKALDRADKIERAREWLEDRRR